MQPTWQIPAKHQKLKRWKKEGEKDRQIDSENKTEGLNEIVDDTEAGPEDKDKTEDEQKYMSEEYIAMKLFAKVKSLEKKALGDEYESSNSKGETSPALEDIHRPCTSPITENVVENALPVQTV